MSDDDETGSSPNGSADRVVGRLAPSPTGLLHLGHAFSLLVAWWQSRSRGGRVILRIDDIDHERSDPRFIATLIDDLKWLGLDWDGSESISSTRQKQHQHALLTLSDRRLVYPCVCSRTDVLRALGAPQQGKNEIRYPGTCRGRFETRRAAELASGRPAALRLVCPDEELWVHDEIYGSFGENVSTTVGDFVVQRRSGTAAYQLTVVVDDAMDAVTHVVRGRDLLASTARQNLISRAMKWSIPRYLHVPLICDHQGRRLAKRDDDLSLRELRERGVESGQIVSWAARVAGQHDGTQSVTPALIRDRFDPTRIIARDVCLPAYSDGVLCLSGPVIRI